MTLYIDNMTQAEFDEVIATSRQEIRTSFGLSLIF